MPLSIPKENLHLCSTALDERLKTLSELGVEDGLSRAEVGAKLVKSFVPDVFLMPGKQVTLEGSQIFVLDDGESKHYDYGSFKAQLARISIEKVFRTEYMAEIDQEFEFITNDLAFVFRPTIEEADPIDIIFGQQVLVPMRGIQRLELALDGE